MNHLSLFLFIFSFYSILFAQCPEGKDNSSIRGLYIFEDSLIFASGSKSFDYFSHDGKHWESSNSNHNLDFRALAVLDKNTIVKMNSGTPSLICKSINQGKTWKTVYENKDTLVFLDGIQFWDDKKGICFGDPINGKFLILRTENGGESWQKDSLNTPIAGLGEAAFAASGTTISILKNGIVAIATGGKESNIHFSKDYGQTWKKIITPIIQGESSQGIFSMKMISSKTWIIAGGDWLKPDYKENNLWITTNQGKSWQLIKNNLCGYISCVETYKNKTILLTGTECAAVSFNKGKSWKNINLKGNNVCKITSNGKIAYFAGKCGTITQVILDKYKK